LEDIPPIIRHLGFIVLLVIFSATGHWMLGNHWPCRRSPAAKPAAHVKQRTAQINGLSVAGSVEKKQPSLN
jgi:hypothetical protein